MNHKYFLLGCFILTSNLFLSAIASSNAVAYELTFFYDSDSGNVSLDTANTRSGEIISYYLRVLPNETSIRFREENHILLTMSPLTISHVETVQESSLSPVSGYFTLGDVLPTGLSEYT